MSENRQASEQPIEILAPASRLTPEQLAGLPQERRTVLESLVTGKSIASAARASGLSRMTIYRWLKSDPIFQAAYNEWHEHMIDACRSRLLLAADHAARAVTSAIKNGDARLGYQLLKDMNMLTAPRPRLTDPDQLTKAAETQQLRREVEIAKEKSHVEIMSLGQISFDDLPDPEHDWEDPVNDDRWKKPEEPTSPENTDQRDEQRP